LQKFRILFVGAIEPYLTTAARRDALLEFGFPVETVDQTRFLGHSSTPYGRLTLWSLLTPPVFAFNREILEQANRVRPDVVWIEKGIFVFPRTIRALRRNRSWILVYHNTDDWKATSPLHKVQWRFLLRALPFYDVHITSNLHNVEEFQKAGFPRVHHMELAANPAVPDPGTIPEAERRELGAPVGFIGHWEPFTERMLLHLVRNSIPVKIYGGGWQRAQGRRDLGSVWQSRLVWGEEYARAIVSLDINIGIVSKQNRNHTASRTFQIPALGAFLLHERNEIVRRYFKEGLEAEFFDSEDELLEKCRYYLEHADKRAEIAAAGRRRCRESGYFEPDRVREILPVLEEALRSRC